MKLSQILIRNYRLLKDFAIDLEQVLSLAIGKNNCGKTSFLSLLEKFLLSKDSHRFSFDDLNIERQQELKGMIETPEFNLEQNFGISMKLYIEYDEKDDLSNLSMLMLDLDPDIKTVVLSYEYSINPEYYVRLKADFANFKDQVNKDLDEKFHLYEENGVKEYWTVFQDKAVTVYNLVDGKYVQQEEQYLPGETIKVKLFPDLEIKTDDIFEF